MSFVGRVRIWRGSVAVMSCLHGATPCVVPPTRGSSRYTNAQTQLLWVPYRCRRLPPATIADVAGKCLAGKRMEMHGDSHMRVMYNAVVARLCSVEGAAVKEEVRANGG